MSDTGAERADAPAIDPLQLLELAEAIAREAGSLLLEASHAASRSSLTASATKKSSRTDLATEADMASEALVRTALARARPDDAVLGEEGGSTSGGSGLTWVVDPLDGTTNFVYGFPGWAVSIALCDEEGALVGVVHDPARELTFTALRGHGSQRNGERLHLLEPPPLAEALIGTGFGYTTARRHAQARLLPWTLPRVRDIRRAGAAALDLCYVAGGYLDGYYEAGLQPWDRAAGLLVALEAGAKARELDGLIDTPMLVVAGEAILDPLCALLVEAANDADGVKDNEG